MISALTEGAGLTDRLAAKARRLAEAHLAARREDPRRWRSAGWLWPLFAKD